MRILICSDGMPAADSATRIGGLLAGPLRAKTTLLGITEKPRDEKPLREALEMQAQSLRAQGVEPDIVVRGGEPIREILNQTSTATYDLVIIGARRTGTTGLYWRSAKTYEVIKAIPPPVLVAIGQCERLKRFLVCTGGKEFIDEAVQLTGKLAAAAGASVTLLHVMAEPPAIYADLVRLEEDVERLLESKSELGLNLHRQKEDLERLGVPTEVHVRHGIVLDQVFEELRTGDHDLIVTGSSQARGMLRHYIMGDLTRSILNHANCPVVVARAEKSQPARNFWEAIKRLFGGRNVGTGGSSAALENRE
jgi:nucleotide-binding universal stress UspA family protein